MKIKASCSNGANWKLCGSILSDTIIKLTISLCIKRSNVGENKHEYCKYIL